MNKKYNELTVSEKNAIKRILKYNNEDKKYNEHILVNILSNDYEQFKAIHEIAIYFSEQAKEQEKEKDKKTYINIINDINEYEKINKKQIAAERQFLVDQINKKFPSKFHKNRHESIIKNNRDLCRFASKYFHYNPEIIKQLKNIEILEETIKGEVVKGLYTFLIIFYISGKMNYHLKKHERYIIPSTYFISKVVGCSQQHVQQVLEKYAPFLGIKKMSSKEIDEAKYTKYRNCAWVALKPSYALRNPEALRILKLNIYFLRTNFINIVNQMNILAALAKKKEELSDTRINYSDVIVDNNDEWDLFKYFNID